MYRNRPPAGPPTALADSLTAPSLSVIQIEGAFVQGYGWVTTEELIWGDRDHAWVKVGEHMTAVVVKGGTACEARLDGRGRGL